MSEEVVSNRVDASMNDVKTPTLNTNTDLVARQPGHEQLSTRNRAMLSLRQSRDKTIRAQFAVYNPVN